jgi:hypothetical protein
VQRTSTTPWVFSHEVLDVVKSEKRRLPRTARIDGFAEARGSKGEDLELNLSAANAEKRVCSYTCLCKATNLPRLALSPI